MFIDQRAVNNIINEISIIAKKYGTTPAGIKALKLAVPELSVVPDWYQK